MECVICHFSLTACLRQTTLCRHTFHKSCLEKWTALNNTCPLCRCDFVLDEPLIVRKMRLKKISQ